MSMEMNKALDLLREIRPSIPKEVLELWCKDRDAFLASHPAVEQAGGDERAAFERDFTVQEGIYFDDKRGEYRSMNLCAIEASDAQDLNLRLQGWQARAALASTPVADESPMAKMADALREKARQEQQAYQDRRNQATEWGPMPEGTEADRLISTDPVAHVAGDETSRYLEWAKDRSAWEMPVGTPVYYAALAQPSPKCATCGGTGMVDDGEITCSEGGIPYENGPIKCVTDCPDCKAQPSPAQAEQAEAEAEAERPEVVARVVHSNPIVLGQCGPLNANDELMTVAQHAASVARWAEMFNRVEQERDVALARVAELERQEPVDVPGPGPDEIHQMAFEEGQPAEDGDGYLFSAEEFDLFVQRLLDSCATPVAWAQHSVPEGWMLVECGIWTQEQVDEMQKTVTRFRNSEFVDDRALAMAVADAGQCKAPEISLAELLAAAPVCRLSRSALTDAQMRRLYDSSTETENERLGFAAFARLIRRAEAVHQITAAPGKEGV